jgi:hypothetical protein
MLTRADNKTQSPHPFLDLASHEARAPPLAGLSSPTYSGGRSSATRPFRTACWTASVGSAGMAGAYRSQKAWARAASSQVALFVDDLWPSEGGGGSNEVSGMEVQSWYGGGLSAGICAGRGLAVAWKSAFCIGMLA